MIKIRKNLRNIFQPLDFTNEKLEVQRQCGICPSSPLATGLSGTRTEFSGFSPGFSPGN